MQRVLSTVVLVGLLFATAAAFAVTEHLKLIKSPIGGIRVSRYLSPGCRCENAKAKVSLKLRHSTTVTVRILDAKNGVVATLAAGEQEQKGRVGFPWDGKTDLGGAASDGRYWPEIELPHRTFLLPDAITLDTQAPLVRSVTGTPDPVSPGSTGPANHLRIRYRLSEQAHLVLWHGSRRLLRTRTSKPDGRTTWDGRTARVPWRAGAYTLTVGAVDLAGNVTPPAQRKQLVVTIRYVALARNRIAARSGRRFSAAVQAFGPYTWSFDHRHGKSRHPLLRLRAPARKGRYRLRVTESGHTASALVVVR